MNFLRFRVPIIAVFIIITLFLGYGLQKITKENGIKALLATDNPDFLFFEEMEKVFGATDQLILGINFKDSVYSDDNLRVIKELTKFFQENEYIDEDDVLSLGNIDNIDGIDGELIIAPLMPGSSDVIRSKVRDNDMLMGKIVSLNEQSTAVIVTIDSSITFNAEILDQIIDSTDMEILRLQNERPDIDIYKSGMVSVKNTTSQYMDKDMKVMFPIAIVITMLILFILLKSTAGVFIPIIVTLFSVVWTLGLKGWLNSPLTMAETVIPIMLIAIGCADGVHIISEFLSIMSRGKSAKLALKETMDNLKIPVILTSLTTSLGFFSLITAPGISVRNMGIFLGFGVLTAMLFSLIFIPCLLSFKKDKDKGLVKTTNNIFLNNLDKYGEFIIRNKKIIIVLSAIFLGISIVGMKNVIVETDQIMFLKTDDPLRVSTQKIQEFLGGVNTLDIIIQGKEDCLKDPQILNFIYRLQKYSESLESVSYTLSLVDYVKKIYYEFMNKDTDFKVIPNTSSEVSNLLFLYEMGGGDKLNKVVNSDYSMGKVSIRLSDTTQIGIEKIISNIDQWLNINTPQGITTKYTNDYIRIVMGDLVTKGQIKSFISTLLAIVILLMLIFKSPVSGILISLPVIIAVCFNFAIMWLTGTTLNIGTSIIASVGMGVGIDYAIHFFQRYKKSYLESNDNYISIINALNDSFFPIFSNAIAVGIGFLALLFSNYYIIAGIGWITGLSMLTTAFCALFVLPAYLAVFEPLKKRAKKISTKNILIAIIFFIPITTISAYEDPYSIIEKNRSLKEFDSCMNTTQMVLIDSRGNKKLREMNIYSLKTDIGENKFINIIQPADVKGTKFLTIGNSNGDDDQRLYLPALNKIRKISSANKNGKFVGSDISFYDMEKNSIDKYIYNYSGEGYVNEIECWIIESKDLDPSSPYSKSKEYISKNDFYCYKKELFSKEGEHIKTITIVDTVIIDNVIITTKSIVEDLKENHKTLLSVSNVVINKHTDSDIFTIKNLN
ncbi:MAG: outer membrane lipoprotein-sorting protein [Spirochaetales bacterium]|nr:outer membrane lipoprotein-sorting protein [Spirochaetales bacterium]